MARFSDVLTIINGKNQAKVENPNGKYPIYGSGGIMGYADDYICESQTVIIGRKGSINKPIFVETPFWNVDTAFGLSAKKDVLLPKYLYYFCECFDFEKLNTTVTIPSLTKANLLNIEIELPTIEQQQEIAVQLDNVESIVSLRKQQLSKLDELVKSRFIELFGGIHDSKIYPYKAVKELTDVVSGGTPSRDISEYWEEGTIPWIKTTELKNNIVTEVEEYITEQGLSNSSAKIVPSGTVLIAMYGQGKTRGMTAYLGIEACTNQACACILPSAKINQTFLWQFFILSYDNLRDMAKGGNQPNLNGNMIKNYPILCPPMELQEQFAVFIEQIDKSKFEIQKSLEKLETLQKALMQKYFG